MRRYVAWPPPDDLTDLVSRAQRDGAGAIETLVGTLRPPLLAYFIYRVPEDLAEDLTQSALIRITHAISRIDPTRADRYVRTVARNLVRTAYRRRMCDGRRYAPSDLVETAESSGALDLDLEYQELAQAIERAATATLPAQLASIVLGLLRGETPAEIAAKQRVSPITIRTRLLRARACLRRELSLYLEPRECAGRAREESPSLETAPERRHKCRSM